MTSSGISKEGLQALAKSVEAVEAAGSMRNGTSNNSSSTGNNGQQYSSFSSLARPLFSLVILQSPSQCGNLRIFLPLYFFHGQFEGFLRFRVTKLISRKISAKDEFSDFHTVRLLTSEKYVASAASASKKSLQLALLFCP